MTHRFSIPILIQIVNKQWLLYTILDRVKEMSITLRREWFTYLTLFLFVFFGSLKFFFAHLLLITHFSQSILQYLSGVIHKKKETSQLLNQEKLFIIAHKGIVCFHRIGYAKCPCDFKHHQLKASEQQMKPQCWNLCIVWFTHLDDRLIYVASFSCLTPNDAVNYLEKIVLTLLHIWSTIQNSSI